MQVFKQHPTLPQGFSITFPDRFWVKVSKNGPVPEHCPELGPCWPWTARIGTSGYGEIQRGGRDSLIVNSHVASYIMHFGAVPEGFQVLHHCDFKPCCNPAHLFCGTDADNVHDMMQKGRDRKAKGEEAGPSKMTWEKVNSARAVYNSGQMTIAALARLHGIHRSQMCRIVHGKFWKGSGAP